MIKKSGLSLIVGMLLCLLFVQNILAVSEVNLKIIGTIGNYSSDVRLRTSNNSNTGFDAYDLETPSFPSTQASFYSSVSGTPAKIDSWGLAERNLSLVYDVPDEVTGDLVFSWTQVTGTNYKAYFSITGSVTDLDMSSTSSYTYVVTNPDNDIYITVEVKDYSESSSEVATDTGDSGSSGGGGSSTLSPLVQQPQINLIFNVSSDKLLFDAGIVITDDFKEIYAGEKMRSVINLQPMGVTPDLDVYLRYYITDSTGNEVDVGDGESETIKVTGDKTIEKTFFTGDLEPGEYTLHLELKYESEPNKFLVAQASSQFVVLSGIRESNLKSIFSAFSEYKLILTILGVAIVILIGLIVAILNLTSRKIKKRKR
ncbi:MAG: hypothetical protein WCX73_04815 [Candidatus Pacearchaeota archaeon]|jgi:hypothetical protein